MLQCQLLVIHAAWQDYRQLGKLLLMSRTVTAEVIPPQLSDRNITRITLFKQNGRQLRSMSRATLLKQLKMKSDRPRART